jgi:uncharacterized protein (DUF849 family)
MLIEAALNGGRSREEHPAIPQSPAELAQAAKESVAAGAGAIHFHVRAPDGRESIAPEDVAAAVTSVRAAIPGTPFGVSTGAWILRDAALRHKLVSEWTVLPDFAAVNFKEDGAEDLARLLLSRGVALEIGFTDPQGTEAFVARGLAARCLRILLEPQEASADAALENVRAIEAVLDRGGVKLPRLLHGLDATAWKIIDAAIARGLATRVGFEDILTLPGGKLAATNAELVAETLRRAASSRPPADPFSPPPAPWS